MKCLISALLVSVQIGVFGEIGCYWQAAPGQVGGEYLECNQGYYLAGVCETQNFDSKHCKFDGIIQYKGRP